MEAEVKATDEQFDKLASGDLSAFDAVAAEAFKEPPKAEEKKEETPTEEPTDKGILAKDNEHVLPYSVLETAREESRREKESRERAEALNKQYEEQIEALKRNQAPPKEREPDEVEQSINDLREHAKTLRDADLISEAESAEKAAALLEKEHAARRGSEDANAKLEQAEKDREAAMLEDVQKEQMRVIENNPVLNFYFSSKEHAHLFDKVSGIEELNRRIDSKFAALSLEKRAQLAVEEFLRANPDAPRPQKVMTQEEMKRKAEDALRGVPTQTVDSLTDIPAGKPPAQNPLEALDKSGMSLLSDLEGLSDEQFEKVFRSLC